MPPSLKPDILLVLDQPVTAVEIQPRVWNVWTYWRTGLMGLVLPGDKDQVTAAFNQALRAQYVRELRSWAQEIIVDRQPEGGPRM